MYRVFLMFLLAMAPLAFAAAHDSHEHNRNEVHTDQLKSWYDENKEMTVLDARSKPYFDGTLLPQARWLSAESTENVIQAAVPSKKGLIVVYCAGVGCPASGWLYDKLTKMGYTNVYEYPEGIKEWVKKGLPTIRQ